jgi:hypothetical protein
MKQTIKVTTDAEGAYSATETVNPPGPFGFTVSLKATLLSPDATTITGTLDINGAKGKPTNDTKNFHAQTGQEIDLGKWKLAGGDNILKVAGQTSPVRANTDLNIEVRASL